MIKVNKGFEDVELLYKIEKNLYELASKIEDETTEYLSSEPSAENRAKKNMRRTEHITDSKYRIMDYIISFIKRGKKLT